MLFNGIVNAFSIDAEIPEGTRHIEMAAHIGIGMPQPDGNIGVLPAGTLRIPLDRNAAEKLIKTLGELVEELPKPSDLRIASNLSQVQEEAARFGQLRGDGPSE
jgi:hypothetical protein